MGRNANVRDGGHRGTLFVWDGNRWAALDIENGLSFAGHYDRLAVVTLEDNRPDPKPIKCFDPETGEPDLYYPDKNESGDYADQGLNQAAIGCDLDGIGEWVVDADALDDLRETYGDDLVVLWEQDEC